VLLVVLLPAAAPAISLLVPHGRSGRQCALRSVLSLGEASGCVTPCAAGAAKLGHNVSSATFFDTVAINVGNAAAVAATAVDHGVNLRVLDASTVTVSLDETTTLADVDLLLTILNGGAAPGFMAESLAAQVAAAGFMRVPFRLVGLPGFCSGGWPKPWTPRNAQTKSCVSDLGAGVASAACWLLCVMQLSSRRSRAQRGGHGLPTSSMPCQACRQ
jgi:Glycine cleavage system P-protein